MSLLSREFSSRERWLAGLVVLAGVAVLAGRGWLWPAYERWSAASALLSARTQEYEKLRGFLAVEGEVDEAHGRLPAGVIQRESDAITLSAYLRELESLARLPSLTIVNAKPEAVVEGPAGRRYPIRLTVSGTLKEVGQFVTRLTGESAGVQLRGFAVRAVQGGALVECNLSIELIRLRPTQAATGTRLAKGGG